MILLVLVIITVITTCRCWRTAVFVPWFQHVPTGGATGRGEATVRCAAVLPNVKGDRT